MCFSFSQVLVFHHWYFACVFSFQNSKNAQKAIEDFTEVLNRDKKFSQAYERRAEVSHVLAILSF